MNAESELLTRATAVLSNAVFGPLNHSTMSEYVAAARRLDVQRREIGPTWGGPTFGVDNPRTASVRRAAWTRCAHHNVAAALRDLRNGRGDEVAGLRRLAEWVDQAEACPPLPNAIPVSGSHGGRPPIKTVGAVKSKRRALHDLPSDWMSTLWSEAVSRRFVHLDGLAVLLVTGCRPAEACLGVGVRRVGGGIDVVIRGAKVRETAGQPWRLLTVAIDIGGPAEHLAKLADASRKGQVLVRPDASSNALSMGVSDLASACLPGRRLSAYDIRHQRASDARAVFGDDLEQLAAWLGHAGLATLRYYGRLPRSAGSRGPHPIAAIAKRPIVRKIASAPALHAVPYST